MNQLRILIVEDSTTIRKYLAEVVGRDPDMVVVGEAASGRDATELCARLRPDVVTMDMILPEMNGVMATEEIMAFTPTPILIVSSSINRGEAFQTYEALAAGAVDVLDKPRSEESREQWEGRFVAAVKMVARIKVITHPRGRLRRSETMPNGIEDQPLPPVYAGSRNYQTSGRHMSQVRLIAIGASTGGPAAISQILQGLPDDFPIPILIVIHVAEIFAEAFGEWLLTQTPMPVQFVIDGQMLPSIGQPGILLAPAGRHTVVENGRLLLTSSPERHSCRPSIDVLFESIAKELGECALLTLLTGMGRDGAKGLFVARQAGCDTVAQDEASSVVFGMPAEAIRMGAARRVLAADEIAGYMLDVAERNVSLFESHLGKERLGGS